MPMDTIAAAKHVKPICQPLSQTALFDLTKFIHPEVGNNFPRRTLADVVEKGGW